mmetsp:Transcript_2541/g.6184  ORF Transcript_2541/g.6184 Transcript_2541/m.6184 type:complete len:201 (+) Transcript_2541:170-772(+)
MENPEEEHGGGGAPAPGDEDVAANPCPEGGVRLNGPESLHGLFPPAFLKKLCEYKERLQGDPSSKNMLATRYWFYDEEIAAELLSYLPPRLGLSRVVGDMRFILYPLGGYIAPHCDGVHVDKETLKSSTTSFLLYLSTIPPGEGGETEILVSLPGQCEEPTVTHSYTPTEGSILLFPHNTPHQGNSVGSYPKFLLRGDMY